MPKKSSEKKDDTNDPIPMDGKKVSSAAPAPVKVDEPKKT
jgi:hypothetical protein